MINLLDIRDPNTLSEAEAEFTAQRYRSYTPKDLEPSDFNLEHLQFLHHHLFQDVYTWAGEVRDVDISKGNTRFCTCARIEPEAVKLFNDVSKLTDVNSKDGLIEQVADLFCELNLLHPFREGHGRVQRFFFEELIFTLGYGVKWPNISQEEWISANVAGVNLNLKPLIKIFNNALRLAS